jgi:hypothetical protein
VNVHGSATTGNRLLEIPSVVNVILGQLIPAFDSTAVPYAWLGRGLLKIGVLLSRYVLLHESGQKNGLFPRVAGLPHLEAAGGVDVLRHVDHLIGLVAYFSSQAVHGADGKEGDRFLVSHGERIVSIPVGFMDLFAKYDENQRLILVVELLPPLVIPRLQLVRIFPQMLEGSAEIDSSHTRIGLHFLLCKLAGQPVMKAIHWLSPLQEPRGGRLDRRVV